jgi:hypothetical protein
MKKVVVGIALIVLSVGTFVFTQQSKADCAELYIDYGPLNGGAKTTQCIPVEGEIPALEFLKLANVDIEGTQEYGDAVVCRVNNYPDSSMETCESMPPEKAYWAVLYKEHDHFLNPFDLVGEWGWAQTGIDQIPIHNGDGIALVFANNGEVKFP